MHQLSLAHFSPCHYTPSFPWLCTSRKETFNRDCIRLISAVVQPR